MQPSQEQLANLSPFQLMTPASLDEVCSAASIESYSKGAVIFKREESRQYAHWLLEGSIDLIDDDFESTELDISHIKMLEEASNYTHTAIATNDCVLLTISQDTLDLILTVAHAAEEQEQSQDDDWMTRLLSSRLFEFVPPANIQALFKKFSPVNHGQGDVIIKQGDAGDFFYVVKHGKASVDRIEGDTKTHLKLLGPGDFFGEDALISNKKRNARVTMLESGELMKLGKDAFNELLVKPASEYVTLTEVEAVIAGGEQRIDFIDVRHPGEIKEQIFEGTRNIPLQLLRQQASQLDKETVYVVATPGRRAELGALLLTQAGFDSYILKQV